MRTDKLNSFGKQITVIIAYALSFLAVLPIIRYLLVYKLDIFTEWSDKYVWARVVFSGPALLIIGIYLATTYKKSIHGKVGLLLIVLGILWLVAVGFTIFQEAA
jgi:glycopeptide antibiotics resistance protein